MFGHGAASCEMAIEGQPTLRYEPRGQNRIRLLSNRLRTFGRHGHAGRQRHRGSDYGKRGHVRTYCAGLFELRRIACLRRLRAAPGRAMRKPCAKRLSICLGCAK
jgi:hypothetical protein